MAWATTVLQTADLQGLLMRASQEGGGGAGGTQRAEAEFKHNDTELD